MRIIILIFGLFIGFQIIANLYIDYSKNSEIREFYNTLKKGLPFKTVDGKLEIYDASLDKNLIIIDQRYIDGSYHIMKDVMLDNAESYAKEVSCNNDKLQSFLNNSGAIIQYNFYDTKSQLVYSFKISKEICQLHSEQYIVSEHLKSYIDQTNEQLPEVTEGFLIEKFVIENENTIVMNYKSLVNSSEELLLLSDEDYIQNYKTYCSSNLFPHFISKGITIKIKTYGVDGRIVNATALNQIVCLKMQ